jgi:hypothetical protein
VESTDAAGVFGIAHFSLSFLNFNAYQGMPHERLDRWQCLLLSLK